MTNSYIIFLFNFISAILDVVLMFLWCANQNVFLQKKKIMLIEIGPDDQSMTDRGNVVVSVSLQFYRSRFQCFGGSGTLFLSFVLFFFSKGSQPFL